MIVADVQNLSGYYHKYKFVVARYYDGELWFYGAYNDKTVAKQAAEECGNGIVLTVIGEKEN